MSSSGHIYLHFKYHPWCMLGCCHFVAHVDNSPSFIPFSSSCLFYPFPAEPHVQNKMFSITLLSQFPLNHLVLTKSTNTPLQTISILFCFFFHCSMTLIQILITCLRCPDLHVVLLHTQFQPAGQTCKDYLRVLCYCQFLPLDLQQKHGYIITDYHWKTILNIEIFM